MRASTWWAVSILSLLGCQRLPSASVTATPAPTDTTTPPITAEPEPAPLRLRGLVVNDAGGCVIRDERSVLCWDLGYDRPRARLRVAEPFALHHLEGRILALHLDDRNVCARFEDELLLCRELTIPSSTPRQFQLAGGDALAVFSSWKAEANDACTIVAGRLACARPRPSPLEDVLDVDFGRFQHGCALRSDGTRTCWNADAPSEPTTSTQAIAGAVQLELGRQLCLRTEAGALWCSTSTISPDSAPLHEVALGLPIVDVTLGELHVCGRAATGEVVCAGNNAFGQLGAGDSEAHPRAVRVPLPGPARELASGGRQSCALVDDEILCWGGALPDLDHGDTHTIPLAATRVFIDDTETCALVDGSLHCWSGSELDIDDDRGGIVAASQPLQVPTALPVAELAGIDFDTFQVGDEVVYGWLFDHLDTDVELSIDWRRKGVSAFAADADFICMAQGSARKLVCVDDEGTQTRIPSISGVTDIELRDAELCVLAKGHLHCLEVDDEQDEQDEQVGEWREREPLADGVEIVDAYNRFELCVVRSSGGIACWDEFGQPFDILIDDAVQACGLDDQLCARTRGGALRCGPGLPDDPTSTTRIETGVLEVAGGFEHVCARIDADGDGDGDQIECIGNNRTGELGKLPDTVLLKPTPISVP